MTNLTRGMRTAAILAALTALTALPHSANAQIGGLIKRAAKVADKVEKTTEPATKGPDGAQQAANTNATLAINKSNIDLFVSVLNQDRKRADAALAVVKAKKDYEAKTQAYGECRNKVMMDPISASEGSDTKRAGELNNKVQAMSERMIKAIETRDTVRSRILSDSVKVLSELSMQASLPGLKKCGTPPSEPSAVDASSTGPKPVLPAGVTSYQFGVLRERIAAWLLTDGKLGPNYKSEKVTFTAEEIAALEAQLADIKPFAEYFRSGAMQWTTWYDVSTWK